MGSGIVFLCGCETKDIVYRENIATMSMVTYDGEGFLICMVHHARRRGWRSVPLIPGSKLADWSFAHLTPIEREAWVVFGELPLRHAQDERELKSTVEDKRDNRDPESLVVRREHVTTDGPITWFVALEHNDSTFRR
jgi:hypothetical protein